MNGLQPVLLNIGATSFAPATYSGGTYYPPIFTGGTTVLIDAISVDYKYRNAILNINKPQSKQNQTGTAASGTATISGSTLTDAGKFGSVNYSNYAVSIPSATPNTNFIVLSNDSSNLTLNAPPGNGAGVAYSVVKGSPANMLIDLKRITETLDISGYIYNDYLFHTELASKKYAEQKYADLMTILGVNGNNSGAVSIAWRDQVRFVKTLTIRELDVRDTAIGEGLSIDSSNNYTQHVDRYSIRLSALWGVFK